ncbi:RNA-binding protein Musashi homolog 1b isoform X1 [Lates japonicus]|uniref:RNA-binding protein Musashi homolog 1b isoform X1 n=1 Tax=Lates japonicus TaxID=270547 RepID=A0AAD3MFH9_LATJO|nr:RNA-binding protein Musashi homolog 1b isoform X1 [Lates japonicus]
MFLFFAFGNLPVSLSWILEVHCSRGVGRPVWSGQSGSAVSQLPQRSSHPKPGFSHSLGGPLIATAFTNGYH